MATVDLTNGQIGKRLRGGDVQVEEFDFDFSANNVVATNIVKLIEVGQFCRVNRFAVIVTTAEGATATADFGLLDPTGTADPNGLDDAVDLNSTGLSEGAAGTDAQMLVFKTASVGDTIYMTPDHDLDAAKITVIVETLCIDGSV